MDNDLIFGKPKMPIDYLPHDPYKAIGEVYENEDVSELIFGQLQYWFYMALSHGGTVYNTDDDCQIRASFIAFYSDLLPYIEATFCFDVRWEYFQKHHKDPDHKSLILAIHDRLKHEYSCMYLENAQMTNPRSVIAAFCLKYSIEYIRRELWDFAEAVSFYSGPFRAKISKHAILQYHMKLQTLVEAGYALLKRGGDSD